MIGHRVVYRAALANDHVPENACQWATICMAAVVKGPAFNTTLAISHHVIVSIFSPFSIYYFGLHYFCGRSIPRMEFVVRVDGLQC